MILPAEGGACFFAAVGKGAAAVLILLRSLADGMRLDCSRERGETLTDRRLEARNPFLAQSIYAAYLFTTAKMIPL